MIVASHASVDIFDYLRGLSQLLHDRVRPKCRASEEIRNLFYECSHEKNARTKARTF